MKFFRLAVLILPLVLAACGLSDQQKADYARVGQSGVSSAVYDKMVHQDPLSISDIKALAHAGVSDAIVLRYLRDEQTVYYLTSEDVSSLRKAGLSASVVDYMLQTPRQYGGYYPPGYGYGFGYGFGDPYWEYPFYPYGGFYGGYGFGGYGGYGYYGHHHWH